MRRIWIGTAALVLAAAACGEPGVDDTTAVDETPTSTAEKPEPVGEPDLLFAGSFGGVTVFDPDPPGIVLDTRPAVPSQQGNAVVRTVARFDGTEVSAVDPGTGSVQWSQLIAEPMELRVAALDGSAAVLGPVRPLDVEIPGRAETVLTVLRGNDERRDYTLSGNFEPETFTHDGSQIVVVEYLPALAPDRYSVRLLDLPTGEVREVFDAHGGARQPMEGTARTQLYSPDGTRLYTYYQIEGEPYVEAHWHGHPEGPFSAFVHVLDLEEGWAHCVELPQPFGTGAAVEPALATSADGQQLYVTDAGLGLVAEIDTDRLAVERTEQLAPEGSHVSAAATVSGDELWVALDDEVLAVDVRTLRPNASFTVPGSVTAVRGDSRRQRLYLAIDDRIDVYDRSGQRLEQAVITGGPFTYADPRDVPISGIRDGVKCAC